MRDPTDVRGAIGAVRGRVHDAADACFLQGGDEGPALRDLPFQTDAGIGHEVGGGGPLERRDERRLVGEVAPDNLDAFVGQADSGRRVDISSKCTNVEATAEQGVRGRASLLPGSPNDNGYGRAHDA